MTGILGAIAGMGSSAAPPGQAAYTTPGTYSWVAPAGVTSVSVVVVGGGFKGGAALSYGNNISVTPGSSYSVGVACSAQTSYFINTCTLFGGAGGDFGGGIGGGSARTGGGNGGSGPTGGGGAGGYSGGGGQGGNCAFPSGFSGSGGGGGGGGTTYLAVCRCAGGGGGVGILGQGANGGFGGRGNGGGGGSGGCPGGISYCISFGSAGGNYGGGGGGYYGRGPGGTGAVRIIWPGNTRLFPSTCTGNL